VTFSIGSHVYIVTKEGLVYGAISFILEVSVTAFLIIRHKRRPKSVRDTPWPEMASKR
jgi:hypothetical protein